MGNLGDAVSFHSFRAGPDCSLCVSELLSPVGSSGRSHGKDLKIYYAYLRCMGCAQQSPIFQFYKQVFFHSILFCIHFSPVEIMKFIITSLVLASASSVLGHATFQALWVNGVDQAATCVRPPKSNSPVQDVKSNDLRCNVGGSVGVPGICKVPGKSCPK